MIKRYQVYLNSNSIAIIDDFEKAVGISRSKILRKAIDQIAQAFSQLLPVEKNKPYETPILDGLIGSIKLKTRGKKFYSMEDDMKYLRD